MTAKQFYRKNKNRLMAGFVSSVVSFALAAYLPASFNPAAWIQDLFNRGSE